MQTLSNSNIASLAIYYLITRENEVIAHCLATDINNAQIVMDNKVGMATRRNSDRIILSNH